MHYLTTIKLPILVAIGLFAVAGIWGYHNGNFGGKSAKNPPAQGEQNMSITLAKGQVGHADESSFTNLVLKSDVPVLVDFYADWCGPCRRLGPVLEELAAENPNVKIVKINVEDSPQLAAEYRVSSIPSLKVFKNGRVSREHLGLASKNELRELLE
jgi:thioredoxin 1